MLWLAKKIRSKQYRQYAEIEERLEEERKQRSEKYLAHNRKIKRQILARKIALGIALPWEIRDYSHTFKNKSANNETTEHDSQQHEGKKDSRET